MLGREHFKSRGGVFVVVNHVGTGTLDLPIFVKGTADQFMQSKFYIGTFIHLQRSEHRIRSTCYRLEKNASLHATHLCACVVILRWCQTNGAHNHSTHSVTWLNWMVVHACFCDSFIDDVNMFSLHLNMVYCSLCR